ncbi:unnamed protein product [Peniophora sp. CBMAI 1063]|nr:unnamed protein product [Peniophora sp. CBMAI 1063]
MEDLTPTPVGIDFQPDILSEHGAVVTVPEEGICLGANIAWNAIPGDIAGRAYGAHGRLDLRPGVRTVYVDTGFRRSGLDAVLHIVKGPVDHAVINVDAFSNEARALVPVSACAYRADLTRDVWLRQQPNPDDMSEVYPNTEEEELMSYEDLLALRIAQIPTEPAPGELQEIDLFRLQRKGADREQGFEGPAVYFNITLTIPEADDGYKVRVDVGDIIDVNVDGDMVLDALRVFNFASGANTPFPTRGRLVAQEGFRTHKIDAQTRSVSGHFRVDGNARMHTGSIGGEMNVHIDAVREIGQTPPPILLTTYETALNATVRLIDAEPERPGYKFGIHASARKGPLNLTLVESDPYLAVTIQADAEDGDAHVKLDRRFEGYLYTQVVEPLEGRGTGAHISLESQEGDGWNAEDPTGEGRKRNLRLTEVGLSEMAGEVMWGEKTWTAPGEGWLGASHVRVTSTRGSSCIEL